MADVSNSPKLQAAVYFIYGGGGRYRKMRLGVCTNFAVPGLSLPQCVLLTLSKHRFPAPRRKDVVNQCLEFACCIGFSFPQRQLAPRTESVLYAFVCVFISFAASRYSLRLWSLTPNKHQRRSFLFPFTSAVFKNNSALMLTPLTEWICSFISICFCFRPSR